MTLNVNPIKNHCKIFRLIVLRSQTRLEEKQFSDDVKSENVKHGVDVHILSSIIGILEVREST